MGSSLRRAHAAAASALLIGTAIMSHASRDHLLGATMPLRLTSPSFAHGAPIPARHTCEGAGSSPPLSWSDAPAGTQSFALIVDDPDAPGPRAPAAAWVHWLAYDIASVVAALPEGAAPDRLPAGTRQGTNSWKMVGYRGPCPPDGRHRYFHKLYALDIVLPDLAQPDKAALERAMSGHVLAQATLIGTYERASDP